MPNVDIEVLKTRYIGKRIELEKMPDDPRPITPGSQGVCRGVDGIGQLLMQWDDGRTLNLIPEVDQFKIVNETEFLGVERTHQVKER